MVDQAIMSDFLNSYNFLCNHPAFGGWFLNSLNVMVVETCSRGILLPGDHKGITIYERDLDPELFEQYWLEAEEDDRNDDSSYRSIEIEYEKFYGEPWKVDHVEVWLETGCVEYTKDLTEGIMEQVQHCHDIDLDVGGLTFEEAIINLAKLVKKHYGDFSCEDFKNKNERCVFEWDCNRRWYELWSKNELN